MKKSLKVLRIVVLVIVVVAVLVVVAIDLFADRALKIGIEAAATKTLNVGVSVEDVELSIMGGRLGLGNLVINNPPGYQHKQLLELKEGLIEINVRSLLGEVVNIKEIRLDGVNVVLEQRGISSNNLQDVIKSIPSKDKEAAEPSGKKLHIDNLEISDVSVEVKLLPIPGKADTFTLRLKPIRMTNLGSDNKLDAAVLSSKILVAIAGGVAEQGAGELPEEVIGTVTSELKRLEALPEVFLKEGDRILKEGKDIGKEIAEGLKGLLKPEKKEE
jgi:hypothetical protein